MATRLLRRSDIIEAQLSYRIVGVLFRVFNDLGPGLQEKYYQRAVAVGFSEAHIPFREQVPVSISFSQTTVGRYFLDFLIDGKVVVELKKGNRVSRRHATQTLGYLKVMHLPLGILAYFGTDGVMFKRMLNTPASHS